ncbi:MAG TPA: hypothetical protein ENK13_03250 [Thermopetrobacter sp.]|nr:hypothetical protein [Thermopetrobacter sp.]
MNLTTSMRMPRRPGRTPPTPAASVSRGRIRDGRILPLRRRSAGAGRYIATGAARQTPRSSFIAS